MLSSFNCSFVINPPNNFLKFVDFINIYNKLTIIFVQKGLIQFSENFSFVQNVEIIDPCKQSKN